MTSSDADGIPFDRLSFAFLDEGARPITPHAITLTGWWQGFAPRLPRWRDFDFLDHAPYAAHLHLIKVRGPDRFEFRIAGDTTRDLLGRTEKGLVIHPDSDNAHHRNLVVYYNQIFLAARPGYVTGSVTDINGITHHFESVDLPLLDDEGRPDSLVGIFAALD